MKTMPNGSFHSIGTTMAAACPSNSFFCLSFTAPMYLDAVATNLRENRLPPVVSEFASLAMRAGNNQATTGSLRDLDSGVASFYRLNPAEKDHGRVRRHCRAELVGAEIHSIRDRAPSAASALAASPADVFTTTSEFKPAAV